jgi:hypothetical protein
VSTDTRSIQVGTEIQPGSESVPDRAVSESARSHLACCRTLTCLGRSGGAGARPGGPQRLAASEPAGPRRIPAIHLNSLAVLKPPGGIGQPLNH